jgi:hypothetical protein
MLFVLLLISRDAGISGDEEVHYKQSEMVYQYFSTFGKDQSALDTPKTHLQYYGQFFDNLVTAMIHWFGIEDIYGFRHLMCSFSGWLTIVVTAMFAAWISGYGAAIMVLLLFSVSPTFLGHSQNNLKDIPFALAYISSIYYSLKLVFSEGKPAHLTIVFLILSIALSIGIRIGGILVVFYLGFFILFKAIQDWIKNKNLNRELLKKHLILFLFISISAYFLGILTWPFALQNPIFNPWKSYEVMTHFPTTVRQIFEGEFEWSDFHPWYYLPKYMIITIPIVIFTGILSLFLNAKKSFSLNQKILLLMVGFTVLFPIAFVLFKNSNLYGSWRHFLFVYPGIVLISGLGIHALINRYREKIIRISVLIVLAILSFHPLKFMAANHPFYYLYYNQLTGGLKGAYGNYETDYYYHSMRKGAEWLQEYLKTKPKTKEINVGGNFPSQWYFRNDPSIKFAYFPYQSRSQYDWDYLIVANSYFSPFQLKNKRWPPENTIHTIFADGVPVCAIIERRTKDDFEGTRELQNGNYIKSALLFQKAQELDPQNELICYKFAECFLGSGQDKETEKQLERCLKINPEYEKALVLSGDIAVKLGDFEKAVDFYQKTIKVNRKYLSAYPKLAEIYTETNVDKARKVLHDCLNINSKYKPALQTLAETYRKSDPEIAKKYDRLINKLK